ncbi:MAG: hypothetical protein R2716_02270 [Microthrixaceae bacterium]
MSRPTEGVETVEPADTARTAETVPQGGVAGVGGIDFEVEGSDTSEQLAAMLTDEQVIFGGVPAPVSENAYYGRILTTCASFHYQGYNSTTPHICRGMMTREVTVTGLWEQGAITTPAVCCSPRLPRPRTRTWPTSWQPCSRSSSAWTPGLPGVPGTST